MPLFFVMSRCSLKTLLLFTLIVGRLVRRCFTRRSSSVSSKSLVCLRMLVDVERGLQVYYIYGIIKIVLCLAKIAISKCRPGQLPAEATDRGTAIGGGNF